MEEVNIHIRMILPFCNSKNMMDYEDIVYVYHFGDYSYQLWLS